MTKSRPITRSVPLLRFLHWLPVQFRILFKISLLTCKMLHEKHALHSRANSRTQWQTFNSIKKIVEGPSEEFYRVGSEGATVSEPNCLWWPCLYACHTTIVLDQCSTCKRQPFTAPIRPIISLMIEELALNAVTSRYHFEFGEVRPSSVGPSHTERGTHVVVVARGGGRQQSERISRLLWAIRGTNPNSVPWTPKSSPLLSQE